jgi:Carbohydrate-selective porin, OprB family
MQLSLIRQWAVPTLLIAALPAQAYDVNDKLSISAILAAAGQCQDVSARLPAETDGEFIDDSMDAPLLDGAFDAFDNSCNFWGLQAAYQLETSLGTGNYRLILAGTSDEFLNPAGTQEEGRLAWGLSFDQALGNVVGAFLRLGWQNDAAAMDYTALYSGGLNFNGSGWGREADNIGLGYAYLEGGNLGLDHTQVIEAYYRFGINDYLAFTADVQYMADDRIEVGPIQEDPQGWILGVRLTAQF